MKYNVSNSLLAEFKADSVADSSIGCEYNILELYITLIQVYTIITV